MNAVLETTLPQASPQPARIRMQRPDAAAWRFTLPAWLLIILTLLIPIVVVMILSFTNYELGSTDTSFIGWKNYVSLAGNRHFWHTLWQTVLYVLMVVPGSVIVALMLAVLIQGVGTGRRFYQCLFFLPVTATLVAMATVWKYLLHGNIGPVNQLLHSIGLSHIEFFSDPNLVLFSLALIGIWQLSGFNMVLFITGLVVIPQDVYDAAQMDGAHRPADRFFTVTLPLLGPTLLFVLVTSSITAFKVFDTVAVLTHGGPQGGSDVLLYEIYLEGFQYFRTGSASAMTIVFLAIILLLSWIQAKLIDKKVHYQ